MEEMDVKNSCEYRWRIHQAQIYLGLILVVTVCLTVGLLVSMVDLSVALPGLGICLLAYGIPFGILGFYQYRKARYLLRNVSHFPVVHVKLDTPSTSWNYRQAVYYTVKLPVSGEMAKVDTNPLFGSWSSICPLEEYNNATVRVWYDADLHKAYVIDKP